MASFISKIPQNVPITRANGSLMMHVIGLPKTASLMVAINAIEKGGIKKFRAFKKEMRPIIGMCNNELSIRLIDRVVYQKKSKRLWPISNLGSTMRTKVLDLRHTSASVGVTPANVRVWKPVIFEGRDVFYGNHCLFCWFDQK
ncbi:hypothetical protein FK220_004055 [Flavobacteriaceae bacterium TP-CH-4]|uniref:Uncharacterized protein n=1 Tax=Pelagihabitans pacificus TaxID=2696054 RepID=A0A967AVS6_9FLAO|nr:hypothetical protein [Pelagihabitans pacificus]